MRDLKEESIAAPNSACRWRDKSSCRLDPLELLCLRLINAVLERCVHNDCENRLGVLGLDRLYSFVQLGEAWLSAPFGSEVGSVYDEVLWSHLNS